MTEVSTAVGQVVDPWDNDSGIEGMEDIGVADVVIPRLQLKHKTATWRDNLSGWEASELEVILLGVVKQRIMWPDETDDGDKPMCKSPDFVHGFPNMRDDAAADKKFPWPESNFTTANLVAVDIAPRTDVTHPNGWSSNGQGTLPCSSCKFKEWGRNPTTGKAIAPRCSEQHTYVVLYKNDAEAWVPALLTLQRSGIKASKSYISSFVQAKQPMFTAITKITLTAQNRGSVDYAVPNLTKIGHTDREMWEEYGNTYRGIRDLIRSAPRGAEDEDDEDGVVASPNVNAPAAAAAPAPAAPQAQSAPAPTPPPTPAPAPTPPPAPTSPPAAAQPVAAAAPDDDLPF